MRRLIAIVLIAVPMLACAFGPMVRNMMLEIASRDGLTPPTTEGLVSYWSMRESGGTVYDEHGDNHGTALPGATFGSQYGVRGSGLYVDGGTNSSVLVENSASFDFRDGPGFSWSFWLRRDVDDESVAAFTKGVENFGGMAGSDFILGYGSSGDALFSRTYKPSGSLVTALTTSTAENPPPANVWAHIVLAWDGTTDADSARLHINGNLAAAVTSPMLVSEMSHDHDIWIGGFWDYPYRWNGSIDEIRGYGRGLTPEEITDLYDWDKAGAGH